MPPPPRAAPPRGPIRASCPRVEEALGRRLLDEYDIVHGVLDNGGRPHTVFLSDSGDSRVHAMVVCSDFDGAPEREPGVVYAARDVEEVWFGSSVLKTSALWRPKEVYVDLSPGHVDASEVGSAVLLVEGRKCTAVSSMVVSFELAKGEAVTNLVSYVGNSGVVYGWVETTRGVYIVRGFNCDGGDAPVHFAPWGARRPSSGSRRPRGLDCVEDPVAAGMVAVPGARVLIAAKAPRRRSKTTPRAP